MRASQNTNGEIRLEVEDNGIGFAADKLARVRANIDEDSGDIGLENGFGIDNVNKRLQLYYGRQYGLSIQSEYQVGTCVAFVIPAKTEEATEK